MGEERPRVWIDDGGSLCYSDSSERWSMPIGSIVLIGEYTNQNGPFADDYFFGFITSDGNYYEFSFYASGRDSMLEALSSQIEHQLTPMLPSSTDFASNVLWPPELAGRPWLAFKEVPSRTWGDSISRFLGLGASKVEQRIVDPILAYVKEHGIELSRQ